MNRNFSEKREVMHNNAVLKENPIEIVMNRNAKTADEIELEMLSEIEVAPYSEVKEYLDKLANKTAEINIVNTRKNDDETVITDTEPFKTIDHAALKKDLEATRHIKIAPYREVKENLDRLAQKTVFD
jgi:hypothetical protein